MKNGITFQQSKGLNQRIKRDPFQANLGLSTSRPLIIWTLLLRNQSRGRINGNSTSKRAMGWQVMMNFMWILQSLVINLWLANHGLEQSESQTLNL